MDYLIQKYLTRAKWANGMGPTEEWMDIDILRDRIEAEKLEDDPDVMAADLLYIEAAEDAAKVIALHKYERWWYYPDAIAEGSYPLDRLPEHVRERAQELYYG